MLSVHGNFRRTNSEIDGFYSPFCKRIGLNCPNFRVFLSKLKGVGKAYQLEANQLRQGILTGRYMRKMSRASDNFFSKAEEKLATGRYAAQEFVQIVSHLTKISSGKMAKKESGKY